MEIVSNLSFSDRMYVPWERLLRVCLIFLLSGMLYLGVQTHMESEKEEPRRDIAGAADIGKEKEILKMEPVGFCKDAGNIAGILPSGDIGESKVRPIPFAKSAADVIKTAGKIEIPGYLRADIVDPGDSEHKVLKPSVGEARITAGDSKDIKGAAIKPFIDKAGITAEDPKDIRDLTITNSEENKPDTEAPGVPVIGEANIKVEESDNSGIQTVVGNENADRTDVVIDGADTDANGTGTVAGMTETDTGKTGTDAGMTEADAGKTGTDAGMTEADANGAEADANRTDIDEDVGEQTIVSGFILDEEGYISGTESDVDLTDGILVFPVESGCVGIREGALSGLSEYVYEIYIPANICDIEPGVFEEFTSFLYIEVAENNPCYYSMDGILHSVTGEEIFIPCE